MSVYKREVLLGRDADEKLRLLWFVGDMRIAYASSNGA